MSLITPYDILADEDKFIEEIKKSRFITYIAPTKGRGEAETFIKKIKEKHSDARHNCWAFVAGRPENGQLYGFSDDGEPSGTAGKPLLNTLIGSGIGEIAVVVTRYYGGIKLGTGGLVRAYSGGLQTLLKQAKTTECVIYTRLTFTCEYSQISIIENLFSVYNGRILQSDYGANIAMHVDVDTRVYIDFITALKNKTNGQVRAKVAD